MIRINVGRNAESWETFVSDRHQSGAIAVIDGQLFHECVDDLLYVDTIPQQIVDFDVPYHRYHCPCYLSLAHLILKQDKERYIHRLACPDQSPRRIGAEVRCARPGSAPLCDRKPLSRRRVEGGGRRTRVLANPCLCSADRETPVPTEALSPPWIGYESAKNEKAGYRLHLENL